MNFKEQLNILVKTIYNCLGRQREYWEKEDCYLKPYYYGLLSNSRNALKEILVKYDNGKEITDETKKLALSIAYDKYIKDYSDMQKIYRFKQEGEHLPKDMSSNMITMFIAYKYIDENIKSQLLLDNLSDLFLRSYINFQRYLKFFESDLFILEENEIKVLQKPEKTEYEKRVEYNYKEDNQLINVIQSQLGTDLTEDGKCPNNCYECCSLSVGTNSESFRRLKRILKKEHLQKYYEDNESLWWTCPFLINGKCSIYHNASKPKICKMYVCSAKHFMEKNSINDIAKLQKENKKILWDLLPKELQDKIKDNPKVKHIMDTERNLRERLGIK